MHLLASVFGFPVVGGGCAHGSLGLVAGRLPRFALSVVREDEP
jgi:hypothetical protein